MDSESKRKVRKNISESVACCVAKLKVCYSYTLKNKIKEKNIISHNLMVKLPLVSLNNPLNQMV